MLTLILVLVPSSVKVGEVKVTKVMHDVPVKKSAFQRRTSEPVEWRFCRKFYKVTPS